MDNAERILLYVCQGIQDAGGWVSRTRLLKLLYLVDVEYYRRHRRMLTGWEWVFYKYGPYVFDYPNVLSRLGIDLTETEGRTNDGRQYFGYQVQAHSDIDDVVGFADRTRIDNTISRWALEDLNILLDHVYFDTEPMIDAERGEVLDFSTIRPWSPQDRRTARSLSVSSEAMCRVRASFAELRARRVRDRMSTTEHLRDYPLPVDGSYCEALQRQDREEKDRVPDVRVDMDAP